MNTSSVKLTAYDIVVAQFEAKTGKSLHELLAGLRSAVPRLVEYRAPEDALLDAMALQEDRTPNQASYLRIDLDAFDENFDRLTAGLKFAVDFLNKEAVFDSERLPTVAVVPVLAALYPRIPTGGDELGNATALIRAFLWRSFFTSRYDRAAASRALQDIRGLVTELKTGQRVAPIFDEELFPIASTDDLMRAGWPKYRQTLAGFFVPRSGEADWIWLMVTKRRHRIWLTASITTSFLTRTFRRTRLSTRIGSSVP